MVIIQYTNDKEVKKKNSNAIIAVIRIFVQVDFWWFSLFVSEKSILWELELLGFYFFFLTGYPENPIKIAQFGVRKLFKIVILYA